MGAEIAELIGIYMISKLIMKFKKSLFGIYIDDGLMVVKGGGPEVDRARKEVISIFLQEDLRITTESNSRCVDFLDIVMDLSSDSTRPFIKPNANTKYVSTSEGCPPSAPASNYSIRRPYYQAAMDRAGSCSR